jgi:UDP-glucuronate 4-epimerase
MKVLVTGAAGFIGMHTAIRLLDLGHSVVGIDNINEYYDVRLKHARLNELGDKDGFLFQRLDISDQPALTALFANEKFDFVIHLAAQAGVRYSITNPSSYIQSNLVGFANILECCRNHSIQHFVYASSSSVYGSNKKSPFCEHDSADHPISLYAATKRSNELMAHSYSHLYGLPTTGLRFFTVYGPWGRPDMAPFLFLKAALEGKPIKVFNNGNMQRDFTYIDDVIDGVVLSLEKPPERNTFADTTSPNPSESDAPYKVFNIGRSNPMPLMDFISSLEASIGTAIEKIYLPMQDGDVSSTYADTSRLHQWTGFQPKTSVNEGVSKFVDWYKSFYSPLIT